MSLLYKKAGGILRDFQKKRGSLKSLVFSCQCDLRTKKKLFALLCKAVKHKEDIEKVIKTCKLVEKEPKLFRSYYVGIVLVCEVLHGKGLQCGGVYKVAITRHIHHLKAALHSIEEARSSTGGSDAMDHWCRIPKYARVNTIKTSVDCLIQELEQERFVRKSLGDISGCSCFEAQSTSIVKPKLQGSMRNCFCLDETVPGLLVFCNCTSLTNTKWYSLSLIILQDKASCLPVHILSPSEGSVIIDACAAPGNKTTQLASIMNNRGHIYAFDRDRKRLQTLELMVDQSGASNVVVTLSDFVKVDPADYMNVKYILVDPSCSGSGIYNRQEYNKNTFEIDRLCQLSSFQCKILNHALKFPGVEKVVYSTCSIHKEENEYVVRRVLLDNASRFDLVHVLPEWPMRGLPVFTKASYCIRSNANHGTNGFFVAMFEKKIMK